MAIAPPVPSVLSDSPALLEWLLPIIQVSVQIAPLIKLFWSNSHIWPPHPCYSLSQYHDIYIFKYLSEPEIISILCYFWSILFLQESKVQEVKPSSDLFISVTITLPGTEKGNGEVDYYLCFNSKVMLICQGREDLQDYMLQKVLKKLICIIWRKKALTRHFRASCLCTFGMREQTHSLELHCKEPECMKAR